ncbi:MAG: G5 domain-containing protein [Oscillospiraceae bacterium]|jgi:uncharacterized protein YabE (DUF348 family)/3D (Asp-Asp-Asp) domain-containing protein|nr:G5 domain-containing protein [Oscillospiraceae bacterium]
MRNQAIPHRKRIIATALVLAAAMIFSASITAYAMNSRTVLIRDDGEQFSFTTTKTEPYEVLRARGITLDNEDYLDLSNYSEEGDSVIRIYRKKTVYLEDNFVRLQYTCAGWVGRLLEQNSVVLGERDKINFGTHDLLEDGMVIIVSRAFDVAVQDYGQNYSITLTDGTVAQAVELAGLTLEGEDYVTPAPETQLMPGMTIHVSRVSYRERTRAAAIEYEVDERNSKSVNLGVTIIEQKGQKGEKKTVYNDKYINGERVDSTVISEEILKEAVKEIRVIGTRVPQLTPGLAPISTLRVPDSVEIVNGRPKSYRSVVTGRATAYATGKGTASGLRPIVPGHIAVNPKQFPYGTKLWVVSTDGKYIYGYAIAADTGTFAMGNTVMVDLFMPNNTMARQWGARDVTVYVLNEPRLHTPYGG